MTTIEILNNYETLGFVFFTFTGIKTELNKKGEEKKKPMGMPNWLTINKDNYKDYCMRNHYGLGIITGKMSNLTVIDFDDPVAYEKMVLDYPELKNYKTIKTNKGFHIYCLYDEAIKTTTNAMLVYDKVDIRNDGGMVFAPPTKYKLLDGTIVKYDDLGGEILPIPDIIINNLKQNQVAEPTPAPTPTPRPDPAPAPKKKYKIVVKSNTMPTETSIQLPALSNINELEKFKIASQCYSKERLSNYDTYFKLTMAVKNTFGDSGKQIWEELCSRGDNYDKNKNDEQWFKYSPKKKEEKLLKFGSLMAWAKEDNRELYTQIFGRKMNWDLSEAEFAKALKEVCFDDKPVLFTGKGKEPEGYLYNGIFWVELSLHNAELQQNHFDKLYHYYMQKLDDEKKEMGEDHVKNLTTKIKELNKYHIRSNVIKIFKADNYVADVEWNKNRDLFIFEDKIFDLSSGLFIDATPEDYINMTCGYKYEIDKNINKQAIRDDIIKIFKSIVKETDFDYFMKVVSTFLIQNNAEEKAYFWLGKGRNGKGTITTLLRNMLGKYWGELNTEYYTTHKHRADEPNQNLFNCRNARVLNTSEVAKDDKSNAKVKFINDSFNRITGNDIINARELGTKTVASFKAGKILIQLNDMPEFSKDINKTDISLRERIVIIELPYSFVDNKDLIEKEPHIYKPIDRNIKTKFETEEYRRVMIDIMFEYYGKYLKDGLVIPNTVQDYTNSYFGTQNIMSWFNATYIPSNEKLELTQIQYDYKEEFGGNISIGDLRKKLVDAGLEATKRCVNGYTKIFKENDESKDDEEQLTDTY